MLKGKYSELVIAEKFSDRVAKCVEAKMRSVRSTVK